MFFVGSRVVIVGGLLGLMLAASCGGSAEPTSRSAPAAAGKQSSEGEPPAVAEDTAFVSRRYGYTITLPAGWDRNKALEDLKRGEVPSAVNPALDRYAPGPDCEEGDCWAGSPTDVSLWVGAAPERGDVGEFAVAVAQGVAEKFPPCGRPDAREETTVDGQHAALLSWSCEFEATSGTSPIFVMNALAIHDGMGYIVGWLGPLGTEADSRDAFEGALGTFAFD